VVPDRDRTLVVPLSPVSASPAPPGSRPVEATPSAPKASTKPAQLRDAETRGSDVIRSNPFGDER